MNETQRKEIEHKLWTEFPSGLSWWKIHLTYERVLNKKKKKRRFKMTEENLHTKLVEKLVNKKFEYWKEEFIKRLDKKKFYASEEEWSGKWSGGMVVKMDDIKELAGGKLK